MLCYSVKANPTSRRHPHPGPPRRRADVVWAATQARLAAGIPADKIVSQGSARPRRNWPKRWTPGSCRSTWNRNPRWRRSTASRWRARSQRRLPSRVNPDVDAQTHRKITRGPSKTSSGSSGPRVREVFAAAAAMPGLRVIGVAVHIGSQITDLAPFRDAYSRLRDLVAGLRADGHAIERLDLGGGLGIPYGAPSGENHPAPPSPAAYGNWSRKSSASWTVRSSSSRAGSSSARGRPGQPRGLLSKKGRGGPSSSSMRR